VSPQLLDLFEKYTAASSPDVPYFEEYVPIFQEQLESFSKVYLVIDALDEAQNDSLARDLTRTIEGISSALNIFCTSREMRSPLVSSFPEKLIEIKATKEDLQQYIQSRITTSGRLGQLCQRFPTGSNVSLSTKISDALDKSASGK
jgi:hypothetical protein